MWSNGEWIWGIRIWRDLCVLCLFPFMSPVMSPRLIAYAVLSAWHGLTEFLCLTNLLLDTYSSEITFLEEWVFPPYPDSFYSKPLGCWEPVMLHIVYWFTFDSHKILLWLRIMWLGSLDFIWIIFVLQMPGA